MNSRTAKPLVDNAASSGWLPSGGLRWIQIAAIAGLIVVGVAYVTNASKSNAAGTMRLAISEPGTTVLPSIR